MMSPATQLDQQLRVAGLPVIGVSLGTEADKATWRVDLEPSATEAQRDAVTALLDAFVPSAAEDTPEIKTDALLAWCATKFGVDVLDATLEVLSGEIQPKP